MKFLDITPTLSVKLDEIVAVEAVDEFHCRVLTESQAFEANFPFKTMIGILEGALTAETQPLNTELLKDISQKVGELPIFAG